MIATLDNRKNHTASKPKTETPNLTFVACVESGPLERQTIQLAESIRTWGGRFSKCPILAVTPRKGFGLQKKTRAAFDRLQVTHHAFNGVHNAPWYNPMNKPAALTAAESLASTEMITWMDSDTLVIREPNELELQNDEDFTAMPGSYRFDIASTERNEHESFWNMCLKRHGIDPALFPSIPAQPGEQGQIRMYWQGGAFSYRRSLRLGKEHFALSKKQVDLQTASEHSGAYFTEQIGLALAVFRKSMRYRVLPASHNFAINALAETSEKQITPEEIKQAAIIHYFGSLWPGEFASFVKHFERIRPDVAKWLHHYGPLQDDRPVVTRLLSRWKRHSRVKQAAHYLETCETF